MSRRPIELADRRRLLCLGRPRREGRLAAIPRRRRKRHRAADGDDSAPREFGSKVPTKLLFSSPYHEEIIYREELDHISENDSSLSVIHTLTRRQPQNWKGYGRRIDRAMLADTAWRPAEKPLAFTCGPTTLVEKVAKYLQELGYESECIKTERFGPSGG